MFLNSFKVSSFRNIARIEVDLGGSHAAFIGPNGAGKTNLLEALYFTLKARTFRSFVQKEDLFMRPTLSITGTPVAAVHNPAAPSHVEIHMLEEGGRSSVMESVGDPEKKRFTFQRNDKRISSKDLSFRYPVIAFSPQDHELIRGGPEVRRRFLDQVFSDICPGYYEVCFDFEHALKQRNRLLKQIADGETSPIELKSWNQVFVDKAIQLYQLKSEVFPSFHHHFQKLSSMLGESFFREISLELSTTVRSAADLEKKLEEDLPKDLGTKWTHSGPHRDDLSIFVYGQNCRTTASQGQGRLLGLLLRWTHAQWIQTARQEKALFLLDDFSSELDQRHREALLESIFSDSNQVLWSATEVPQNSAVHELFKSSKLLNISGGSLQNENLINSTI
jgi:DNA replication and repair protein RecF